MTTTSCKGRVSSGTGWRSIQCSRQATHEEYCWQHHPEATQKRQAETNARYERELQALYAKAEARSRRTKALNLLKEAAAFLSNGTPIHPGSELAESILELIGDNMSNQSNQQSQTQEHATQEAN